MNLIGEAIFDLLTTPKNGLILIIILNCQLYIGDRIFHLIHFLPYCYDPRNIRLEEYRKERGNGARTSMATNNNEPVNIIYPQDYISLEHNSSKCSI
jgi:hypothetical protein